MRQQTRPIGDERGQSEEYRSDWLLRSRALVAVQTKKLPVTQHAALLTPLDGGGESTDGT